MAIDPGTADLEREVQIRVTRVLADAVSLVGAGERLLESIGEPFGWEIGALYLVDEDENVLRAASTWRRENAPDDTRVLGGTYAPGQGLPGRVWAQGGLVFLPELRSPSGSLVLDAAARAGLGCALAFPILAGTEVIGVLELMARRMDPPGGDLGGTFSRLGSQIGAFVARCRAEQAHRDSEVRYRALAEQLDREQRFLRALLDTLVEGIVACDAEGRPTLVNRATREFHAAPDAAPSSAPTFRADGRTPMSPEEAPLFRAFRGELVQDQEIVVKAAGRLPRTLIANARPIIDDAGQKLGAVVAMQDVTERRRLEEQFRQAQKMEALGSLAGGVAHDFNNLLTTILGYTELLMMRYGDPALHDDLGEVKKAAERASALTQKLLAFSRKQVVEPRVLDLNAVVGDLEKILKRLLGASVRLETRLAPRIGHVRADPGQLEQVLLNLVVNARDAMPKGGGIVLETGAVDVSVAEARANVGARAGPHVTLSVADEGIGIPPELLPRIFEPFFTTKEEGKGTGLGLSTVFGIVAQAGGHIRVASEPGRGTRFTVLLPRADEPVTRRSSLGVLRVARASETVLIVDDQEPVRALARRVLESAGYRVLEAATGEAALAVAGGAPRVDLLLTDVVAGGVAGPELARRLRATRPAMRVLFMSGYADPAVLSAGEREEIGFLAKPFSARELAERVRRALDDEPQVPTR